MSDIGGLVCPLVFVGFRVEEIYVHVYEKEYSTVVIVMLGETWFRCEMTGSVRVCPVGGCFLYGIKVVSFGL